MSSSRSDIVVSDASTDVNHVKPMMRKSILFAILVMLVFGVFGLGLFETSKRVKEEELDRIEVSIKKAVANCYAIEGFYPSDIAYLEENYGIQIDRKSYHIYYSASGSNLYPEIAVYPRG